MEVVNMTLSNDDKKEIIDIFDKRFMNAENVGVAVNTYYHKLLLDMEKFKEEAREYMNKSIKDIKDIKDILKDKL